MSINKKIHNSNTTAKTDNLTPFQEFKKKFERNKDFRNRVFATVGILVLIFVSVAGAFYTASRLSDSASAADPSLKFGGESIVTFGDCQYGGGGCDQLALSSSSNSSVDTSQYNLIQISNTTATPGQIIINEINWGGSDRGNDDQWLELYNTTDNPIDLGNTWVQNSTGGVQATTCPANPTRTIPAKGYFLVARYEDTSANSVLNIAADCTVGNLIFDNSPTRTKEVQLKNISGTILDKTPTGALPVTPVQYAWPAGSDISPRASMARKLDTYTIGQSEIATNWFSTTCQINLDTAATLKATPKGVNDCSTTQPQPLVTDIYITEFNWAGTSASNSDQWIELYNNLATEQNLTGLVIEKASGNIALDTTTCAANGNFVIPAKGYYLIAKYSSSTTQTLLNTTPDCVASLMSINNNGENLSVKSNGVLLDQTMLAG